MILQGRNLSIRMQGDDVKLLQKELRLLGFNIGDRESYFGSATRVSVMAFQRNNNITPTGIVEQNTARLINAKVDEISGPPPADRTGKTFLVHGHVVKDDGSILDDVVVRAYDIDLRHEQLLGEGSTRGQNAYKIPYSRDQFKRAEKKQADLLIRVFKSREDESPLAESSIHFNASDDEKIDIIIGEKPHLGPSEFLLNLARLSPVLDDVAIENLKEDDETKDISFLTGETGIDSQLIIFMSQAYKLSIQVKTVPPPVFYGLFRQNLPLSLAPLLAQGQEVLRRALQSSLRENLIPYNIEDKLEEFLENLQKLVPDAALQRPGRRQNPLRDLLDTVLPDTRRQKILLEAYTRFEGTPKEFWTRMREQNFFVNDKELNRFQFSLQVGALTKNHIPMVKQLQLALQNLQIKDFRDLAKWQKSDWLTEINRRVDGNPIGIPPGIPGKTREEKAQNYAGSMARILEETYPNEVIAHRAAADFPQDRDLSKFLLREVFKEKDGFDIATTQIEHYLKKNDGQALRGISRPEQLKERLKMIQRIFKLTPRYSEMQILMKAGRHSAYSIVKTGENVFVNKFGKELGTKRALQIYEKAQQIKATSFSLWSKYGAQYNTMEMQALGSSYLEASDSIPNWTSLFGSLDLCECRHCRSVYGPAAYLVDVLHFLSDRPSRTAGQSAKGILFQRRPDIDHIELTCKNTNTPLPYVDLVNEILEEAVSPGTGTQAVDRQTRGTQEELSATPEHINEAAYNKLANAVFPWDLPYSLWLNEGRAYLGHLGIKRHKLMEKFRSPSPYSPTDLNYLNRAAEYLGLSLTERKIITGASLNPPKNLWNFWGLSQNNNNLTDPEDGTIQIQGTWTELLRYSRVFLHRSSLSFQELQELLQTKFINPNGTICLDPPEICDLELVRIKYLNASALDRIHRFVRVWRKLGWTIQELDRAISVIQWDPSDTANGDSFIVKLYHLQMLAKELKLDVISVLSFWTEIDTYDAPPLPGETDKEISLYNGLFQNKTVINPVDRFFRLNAQGTELQAVVDGLNPKLTDPERIPTILAALGIASTDYTELKQSVISGDALNLQSLSILYRHVTLAKALNIKIKEMISLLVLTEIDPFDSSNPQNTRLFMEAVSFVKVSGFTIQELDYLLRHQFEETAGAAPSEQSIGLFLWEVRKGLQKIAQDNLFESDPAGKATKKRLAVILDSDRLDEAVAIIEGNSPVTNAQQNNFIDTNFAGFLDTADANIKLVGAGALTLKQERYDYVLEPLLQYLTQTQSESFVKQKVGEALGIESAVAEGLLTNWIDNIDTTQKSIHEFLELTTLARASDVELQPVQSGEAGFAAKFQIYIVLDKIAAFIKKLNITTKEMDWLFCHGPAAGYIDFTTLPIQSHNTGGVLFRSWKRTVDVFHLRDAFPAGETTFFDLFDFALGAGNAKQDFLEKLSAKTCWNMDDLEALCGKKDSAAQKGMLKLSYPGDYQDEQALKRLKDCFEMLKRLGTSAAGIDDLIKPNLTAVDARSIRQAVKAKYDEAKWLEIARPLRDILREKQRSSLVSYLVARPDPASGRVWYNTNGLYAYYLIDVEMSPCQLSSRIKQAISSVQLFVQRCLMNLEIEVDCDQATDIKWLQWDKWMKNYRVWEANRKIFLYPENWIEPDLRDDKSPFFKELENELMQDNITDKLAEAAFQKYLEKLDQVARLEVCGLYHQYETDLVGNTVMDVLHVFARTRGEPHLYFYRRWEDRDIWTPWEKVGVDIEGEHLIPVIWNRRPHVFWPIFTERAEEKPVTMPGAGKDLPPAERYWEIRLAWSEYKDSAWQAKKVTTEKIVLDGWGYFPSKQNFRFAAFFDQNQDLIIAPEITKKDKGEINPVMEQFRFTGCDKKVEKGLYQVIYWDTLPDTESRFMDFVEKTGINDFEMVTAGKKIQCGICGCFDPNTIVNERVLGTTPGIFQITLPHQYRPFASQAPFFYEDDNRTFFVIPETRYFILRDIGARDHVSLGMADRLDRYFSELAVWKDPYGPKFQAADALEYRMSFSAEMIESEYFEGGAAFPETVMGGRNNRFLGVETESSSAAAAIGIPKAEMGVMLGRTSQHHANIYMEKAKETIPGYGSKFYFKKYFDFRSFYHPYLCHFTRELKKEGIKGLLRRSVQVDSKHVYFQSLYTPYVNVKKPYPLEDVDFSRGGAYALYNWELFFHAPLLIACWLNKNQKFKDAQKWFHFIFDPMDSSSHPVPQKYWKMRHFFETTDEDYKNELIRNLLQQIASGSSDPILEKQVKEWRKKPFIPHLIARMRTTAFQKTVVMKYIDNLIDWGDQLFRRDTMESINEATMLYVLAAEILGPRPKKILSRVKPEVHSFHTLEPKLDDFSNALVQIENLTPPPQDESIPSTQDDPPLPPTLYFCIPRNDVLLKYWDRVEDRLFKIRHCMNIKGIVRQLPLFAPPIDPAMLVRAAAAGIDISSALNDMHAPLPYYRFSIMAQKATELCNEVKALGNALLTALEKRDAEKLALLRSTHELKLLKAMKDIKKKQLDEAEEQTAGLRKSKDMVTIRHNFYKKIKFMNSWEDAQLTLMKTASVLQFCQMGAEIAAGVLHLIPDAKVGCPTTIGVTYGGANIASAVQSFGSSLGTIAAILNSCASMTGTYGSYERRWDEWKLQESLAYEELQQIEKQIAAAEIRESIAEKELKNHELQIKNTDETDKFLHSKFTNQELYNWIVGQVSSLYFQSYQLAYDIAKRAEMSYRHEFGISDSDFIKFGYWDSLKKGLLAGEKLTYDLKRMEAAYLEQNQREYEITRHISLKLHDPMALITLKETGGCVFAFPEAMFDMDFPGHYMRRIKTVSLTVPCVTGPHTGINCTLTQLISRLRADSSVQNYADKTLLKTSYGSIQSIVTSQARDAGGLFELNFHDERYLPFEGSGAISEWRLEVPKENNAFDFDTITDVVFTLKYTAREGGGPLKTAASQAAVLPVPLTQDTATPAAAPAQQLNMRRLFSAKHEFPDEWHRFLHPPDMTVDRQTLELDMAQERFPYLLKGRTIQIEKVEIFARLDKGAALPLKIYLLTPAGGSSNQTLESNASYLNGLNHKAFALTGGTGTWKIEARDADVQALSSSLREEVDVNNVKHYRLLPEKMDDIFLLCHYKVT